MKIYLVGPLTGLSYTEAFENIEKRKSRLEKAGYTVIHPLLGKEYLKDEKLLKAGGYSQPLSTNHAIFSRDKWMVQSADIVLADLTPGRSKVSVGSMFELAWASYLHKHVIVVMDEANIHNHAFVKESASSIFDNLNVALEYLEKLIK
jgi:nucleoside 2-deoxyribosyltransferase